MPAPESSQQLYIQIEKLVQGKVSKSEITHTFYLYEVTIQPPQIK